MCSACLARSLPSGLTTRDSSEGIELDRLETLDDLPRRLPIGLEVETVGINDGVRVVEEPDPGRIELGELGSGSNQVMLLHTEHEIRLVTPIQWCCSVTREVEAEFCSNLLHRVRRCIACNCMRART